MTVITQWYTEDGKLGVDLNYPNTSVDSSSSANPSVPGPNAKIGDKVDGNAGSEWMFVLASATVTAAMIVGIDKTGRCQDLTSAMIVSNVYTYGIAQFQATLANAGEYFWALLKANYGVKLIADTSSSVGGIGCALYIGGSQPGTVMVTAVTNRLNGIAGVVSVSSGNSLECVMNGYILPGINLSALPSTV